MESVIVIGAGAAGLMAAYELSKKGKQVTILEASNRLGGRIHTIYDPIFSQPIELGAEFIHGNLKLTLSLLKQAGINHHETGGKMFHIEKGQWKKQPEVTEDWNELMQRMAELKEDMLLSDFLNKFFGHEKYKNLRESVRGFAEGFDLADLSKASTLSLYKEWKDEMGKQYRIDGGYQKLIDYLESQCRGNGCIILKNCCVKKITWQKNEVKILTMCSQYFECEKIIIAVPLSVLQANKGDISYIDFTPSVKLYIDAARKIGFGTVIKVILQFEASFWNDTKKNISFIFTNEELSTWWTQLPHDCGILTGWLGGSKALKLKDVSDETILEVALHSLSAAFATPAGFLRNKLQAYKIANWCTAPFIFGGYSYNTPESQKAKKLFQQPVEQTIFFAGEALYQGGPSGTVEAALISGKQAALKILQ